MCAISLPRSSCTLEEPELGRHLPGPVYHSSGCSSDTTPAPISKKGLKLEHPLVGSYIMWRPVLCLVCPGCMTELGCTKYTERLSFKNALEFGLFLLVRK